MWQSHQEGGRGEIATVLGGYKEPIWGSSVAILAGFNFYGVCNSLEGGNENHWNLRNACKGIFVNQGAFRLWNMEESQHYNDILSYFIGYNIGNNIDIT